MIRPWITLTTDFGSSFYVGQIVKLTNSRLWNSTVSPTFHGRDIMVPVAATIAGGVSLSELGEPQCGLAPSPISPIQVLAKKVLGMTVSSDSFGNLLTNIRGRELNALGRTMSSADSVTIQWIDKGIENRRKLPWIRTYGERPSRSLVLRIVWRLASSAVTPKNCSKMNDLRYKFGSPQPKKMLIQFCLEQWAARAGQSRLLGIDFLRTSFLEKRTF
jgi:S-adenosylmethionine hydrolase